MSKNESHSFEDEENAFVQLEEEKEFWEDKLLELKLLAKKKQYEKEKLNKSLTTEVQKIADDNKEKLINIENLKIKIQEIKNAKELKEQKLNEIKNRIDNLIQNNKEITDEFKRMSFY